MKDQEMLSNIGRFIILSKGYSKAELNPSMPMLIRSKPSKSWMAWALNLRIFRPSCPHSSTLELAIQDLRFQVHIKIPLLNKSLETILNSILTALMFKVLSPRWWTISVRTSKTSAILSLSKTSLKKPLSKGHSRVCRKIQNMKKIRNQFL